MTIIKFLLIFRVRNNLEFRFEILTESFSGFKSVICDLLFLQALIITELNVLNPAFFITFVPTFIQAIQSMDKNQVVLDVCIVSIYGRYKSKMLTTSYTYTFCSSHLKLSSILLSISISMFIFGLIFKTVYIVWSPCVRKIMPMMPRSSHLSPSIVLSIHYTNYH